MPRNSSRDQQLSFLSKAADALVRGEGHFREILEIVPTALYATDPIGQLIFYNDAAAAHWGLRPALGDPRWYELWKLYSPDGTPLPHDRAPLAHGLMDGQIIRTEAVTERPDGSRVPFLASGLSVRDASGKLLGAANLLTDITDYKLAEQQEQRLAAILNEMRHRIRNTLAIVQAIALRTLRSSSEDERTAFTARLQALAGIHELLTLESWNRASLRAVVNSVIEPFQEGNSQQFLITGPDSVWLAANKALPLAMALHELATNAVKFGALSSPTGRVRIDWSWIQGNPSDRVTLFWRESGGPAVQAPEHQGFGTLLIERALQPELASAKIEFKPKGILCTLDISL